MRNVLANAETIYRPEDVGIWLVIRGDTNVYARQIDKVVLYRTTTYPTENTKPATDATDTVSRYFYI